MVVLSIDPFDFVGWLGGGPAMFTESVFALSVEEIIGIIVRGHDFKEGGFFGFGIVETLKVSIF